jgi:TRAP-type C4-dicarboxylate transport system permease small subunit
MLHWLGRGILRTAEYTLAGLLCLMTMLIVTQVFYRYALNDPLTWSEELARLCMIWLGFLGSAVALSRRTHIRIEGLDVFLPTRIRKPVERTVEILGGILLVVMTVESFKLVLGTRRQLMAALQIPVSYMYGAVLVGMALMAGIQLTSLAMAWIAHSRRSPASEEPKTP